MNTIELIKLIALVSGILVSFATIQKMIEKAKQSVDDRINKLNQLSKKRSTVLEQKPRETSIAH